MTISSMMLRSWMLGNYLQLRMISLLTVPHFSVSTIWLVSAAIRADPHTETLSSNHFGEVCSKVEHGWKSHPTYNGWRNCDVRKGNPNLGTLISPSMRGARLPDEALTPDVLQGYPSRGCLSSVRRREPTQQVATGSHGTPFLHFT